METSERLPGPVSATAGPAAPSWRARFAVGALVGAAVAGGGGWDEEDLVAGWGEGSGVGFLCSWKRYIDEFLQFLLQEGTWTSSEVMCFRKQGTSDRNFMGAVRVRSVNIIQLRLYLQDPFYFIRRLKFLQVCYCLDVPFGLVCLPWISAVHLLDLWVPTANTYF